MNNELQNLINLIFADVPGLKLPGCPGRTHLPNTAEYSLLAYAVVSYTSVLFHLG